MASILENFTESLQGAVPGFKQTLVSVQKALQDQNEFDPANFNKNLGYTFRVLDLANPALGATGDSFTLQINPQELSQNEPFAIQITPTQKGIISEHQGNIFKDLVIAGTTGFAPNAGAGGVSPVTGNYRFGIGETGFSHFHKFRNYIRNYVELKKDPVSSTIVLIFENPKDSEFFIIEPLRFELRRSRESRMTYNYNIQFKVLGRLIETFQSKSLGWFDNLKAASDQASEYIQEAQGVILGATDFLTKVSSDFANLVLTPLQNLNLALQSLSGAETRILDIPRQNISRLFSNVKALKSNVAEVVGIDLSLYNSLVGRKKSYTNIQASATVQNYRIMNALAKAERGLSIVLSNNEFFGKTSLLDISQDVLKAYNGKLRFVDSTTAIPKIVLFGDTIQSIATRELGNASRFRELILLNQLKFPYISNVRADGVLIPGDTIMIPIVEARDANKFILLNQDYNISKNLSFAEKQLGIDLALDKNFDLIVNNVGDLHLVASQDNAVQAVKIKLGLEKGSLKYHPEIGNNIRFGEKITSGFVGVLVNDLKRSIVLDPRFEDAKFQVKIDSGTVSVNGFIKERLFNLSTPINLLIKTGT